MLQEAHTPDLEEQCADAHASACALNTLTARWHTDKPQPEGLLFQLHHANFELWHLEDRARDTNCGDSAIAETKRCIDRVNQQRNDTVEAIDAALLDALNTRALPVADAALHSETPGQMLDRLSILSLKLFHTELETAREDASSTHRERNRIRLATLREQQHDLAGCLAALWIAVLNGTGRFKQYRQHKMYNDPALNPVLYAGKRST